MKTSEVHILLGVLIHTLLQQEGDGWSPISILHRVMTEGSVNRAGQPGHRILSRDLPRGARLVQPAFNALSLTDKIIVITKHMPPPIGYERWQDLEKARYLGERLQTFRTKYSRIIKKVKRGVECTANG